jgi:hypothetical protein
LQERFLNDVFSHCSSAREAYEKVIEFLTMPLHEQLEAIGLPPEVLSDKLLVSRAGQRSCHMYEGALP